MQHSGWNFLLKCSPDNHTSVFGALFHRSKISSGTAYFTASIGMVFTAHRRSQMSEFHSCSTFIDVVILISFGRLENNVGNSVYKGET